MTFRRLAINGKYLGAGPTGVHRVANELTRQLAARGGELAELFPEPPCFIAPPIFQVVAGIRSMFSGVASFAGNSGNSWISLGWREQIFLSISANLHRSRRGPR
jgi:hypothetical protein